MDFRLSKEQIDIKNAAREFALGEFSDRAMEFDRNETFDLDIWRKAAELGFVAGTVSEDYGGPGLGRLEACLIVEEFWAVDPGIGLSITSTAFGSDLILKFGTEEQKKKYLPPLPKGDCIMGSAITESDAGSDVTNVSTTAVRDGDEYVINGSKMFITNGDIANYLMVLCRTNPDNPKKQNQFSLIIVETDRPGFEANKLHGKLGLRACDTAEISFNNVRVPASNLIGEKEGEGFRQVMYQFNMSRVVVSAAAVGLARAALEESIAHTKKRIVFGEPLASFQATQFKIAEMATLIRAARNLYYEAAWLIDSGNIDYGLIAMSKWFSGQMAVKCADEALQMHGGYGYMDEYKVQRIYRDAKILEIYEGTKEIEKIIVARNLLGKF